MDQADLFPIRLVRVDPGGLGSADATGYGEGEDGQIYALKTNDKHAHLPAIEWICSNIAHYCGIAVPPFRILLSDNGHHYFGSRWEGGPLSRAQSQAALTEPDAVAGSQAVLPAIYVFDAFVHNVDRHIGNYLCRPAYGNTVVLAFDWSRALFFHGWPLPDLPLPYKCNTLNTFAMLKKLRNTSWEWGIAEKVLNRLWKLSPAVIKHILEQMPEPWLDNQLRQKFVAWWGSDLRIQRIDVIRQEIQNQ